jgi:hypothetical protein
MGLRRHRPTPWAPRMTHATGNECKRLRNRFAEGRTTRRPGPAARQQRHPGSVLRGQRAHRLQQLRAPGLVGPRPLPIDFVERRVVVVAVADAVAARRAQVQAPDPYEAGRVTYGTLVGGNGLVSAFTLKKWMGHADMRPPSATCASSTASDPNATTRRSRSRGQRRPERSPLD